MNRDWLVLAGLGVLALLALLLAVALLRTRSRTRHELAAARSETADLRRQLDQIERILTTAERPRPRVEAQYTITELGTPQPREPAPVVEPSLFADIVLREAVVKAASFAHGVRRAVGAESRNRIRFEVRREVRRARKQRRADTREAVREWQARQRAGMGDGSSAA